MYSIEQQTKAIKLYIKYDQSTAYVIHELGYPDRKTLPIWYAAYLKEQETGILKDGYSRYPKYSSEQKITAVKHYLEHGCRLLLLLALSDRMLRGIFVRAM